MSEAAATDGLQLTDYPYRLAIPTRWGDNDMLGHLNNVVYHRCIEDIVTKFTRLELDVDWLADDAYPVSVETQRHFRRELSWPETVSAGLRVLRLGETSLAYGIGLFAEAGGEAAATGRFVHVFVDRDTQRPVRVPDNVRTRLAPFMEPAPRP